MRAGVIVASGLVLGALLVGSTGWRASAQAPQDPRPGAAPATPLSDPYRVRYPPDRAPVLALPGGETRRIASVLRIETPMRFGDHVWNADGVPPGIAWVRVDTERQIISVFRGGHEIGSAVILYGAEAKPTPVGRFQILQKAADYHSRTYDADMPFMLRLTQDGVAIHGSLVSSGRATHGCIGVPEAFAQRLFAELQVGDRVFIVGAPAA